MALLCNLARSAKLPTGLQCIFCCVNFFLFSFLRIARRTIISGSAGPIFKIFSPYERALGADDGSVPYFPIGQGTLPWQPNNVG